MKVNEFVWKIMREIQNGIAFGKYDCVLYGTITLG